MSRAVRVWLCWLQAAVPAFVLHELAHWTAAKLVAADARLLRTPNGRVQCATAWDASEAWQRVAVAFAPAACGGLWALGMAATGAVAAPTGAMYLAWLLWGSLNLVVLALPSPADIQLALGAPGELNASAAERGP